LNEIDIALPSFSTSINMGSSSSTSNSILDVDPKCCAATAHDGNVFDVTTANDLTKLCSKEEKGGAMRLLVQELGGATIESLPVIAIVNEHVHLLDCLLEKITDSGGRYDNDDDAWTIVESDESALNSRKSTINGHTIFDVLLKIKYGDRFIEPLLYIGLDATPYSGQIPTMNYRATRLCKPSQSVVKSIYRSRILCFFQNHVPQVHLPGFRWYISVSTNAFSGILV